MANKKLNVYYHGLHVGTFAEMQYQLVSKSISLAICSRRARLRQQHFRYARVRILPEAFCRIGKQFPIREQNCIGYSQSAYNHLTQFSLSTLPA